MLKAEGMHESQLILKKKSLKSILISDQFRVCFFVI